ncbi:FliA/WhiG family RNA polymerase sigma factor [Butyrivibrio sp. M55]|jgi:RNA polymerase sigma factor for flagellar operon FliA|uniref:FliA/WhiG family RNA polymerase sigma factor n=1 Tax=Butyrivibrio sp. M55 TaxID=1855323 RepID=UPI0008E2B35A|nr:FliA/WhiG family RNA polymerase sigma factor [Butyrivibrio sp. M55]SFU34052.1 RNA polymerase sigma factor for flagellar operon FliA [Butyrivibrio sp. M55]
MDDAARNKLWTEYGNTKSGELREQLILEYAPLVKLVAGRLSMYLGFNVEYDDLVGYGIFGLIDAIDKFDLMKDVKFETYASLRIRGAILDQIRKMDWIPRTIRQRQKKIETAIREIEKESGHIATDAEIAAKMDITEDEYQNWQNQMKVTGVVSLNEFMDQGADIADDSSNATGSGFTKPEEAIEKEELKKMLAESLEHLTDKEKKVILFYYYEELTLKEISEVLEVSESRVSQLHTKALQKMREKLGDYLGIITNSR